MFMLFKFDINKLHVSRRTYHPESLSPHHTLSLFPFLLRLCLSSGFAFKYPLNNPSKSRLHLILGSLLRKFIVLGSIGFSLP
jgi:hypothetical protein